MKIKSKKILSLLLALATTTTVLSGCNGTKTSDEKKSDVKISQMSEKELEEAWKKEDAYGKTLKIAYNGGACLGGWGIAETQGFYKKEGIKVDIVSTSNMVHDAVATGKAVAGGDHISTVTVPVVNGMGYTIVTASQTGCKSLYVLSDSGINKTSDLVGKTIGLPDGIGASDHNLVYRYLMKDNIDINKVKYKAVSIDAAVQAMKKGEIQAVNASDMWARQLVEDGTLKPIRSITTDKDFQKEPCCVAIINNDFLKKNPITSYKLAKAFSDANDWIQEHPDQAAKDMIDHNWASGTPEKIAGFIREWNFKISDEDCENTLRSVLDDYKKCKVFENNDFDTEEMLKTIWNPILLNN